MNSDKILKCFFLVFLIFSNFIDKSKAETHILIPGVGYDNIRIDSTSLNDIIEYYGKNYEIDSVHYPRPFDSTKLYCINYEFNSIGVTFSFRPNSKSLFCISLKSPFSCRTNSGIVLGISTFGDIENGYGKADWSFIGNEMAEIFSVKKEYNGISFYKDLPELLSIADFERIDFIEEKINRIDIVQFSKK